MLGELLGEMALNIVGDVVSDVAPFALEAGAEIAQKGIDFAIDKYNIFQKVKIIKECLGVEEDIYLKDAIAYWELLDNIDSSSFEGLKKQLMKI